MAYEMSMFFVLTFKFIIFIAKYIGKGERETLREKVTEAERNHLVR